MQLMSTPCHSGERPGEQCARPFIQHPFPAQIQVHFIPSGTRFAQLCQDSCVLHDANMFGQEGMDHGPRTLTLKQVRAVCTRREIRLDERSLSSLLTGKTRKREESRERERDKYEGREKEEGREREGTREREGEIDGEPLTLLPLRVQFRV